jgi:hypothetical protein
MSARTDEDRTGIDWEVGSKKECKVVVFSTDVALFFFGLWERGMRTVTGERTL